MLNLNKTKRNIALILALVMALAMCLVGCTDQDARDAAEEAKKTAEAAVTTQQLTTAIENALKGIDTGVSADKVAQDITAALADYALKSDIPEVTVTDATVKTAIENALKEYQKSAMTDATVKDLAKEVVGVYASSLELDKNLEKLGALVTSSSELSENLEAAKTALNKEIERLDTAIKALQDGALSLDDVKTEADKKIDIKKWDAATDGVVKACIKVDELERTYAGLKEDYTSVKYQEIVDICYGAKIRLYRAVDTESFEKIYKDAEDAIKAVPTLQSEAKAVEELIQKIAEVFPVTTEDADVVNAANAAYKKLLADYNITDVTVLETKDAKLSLDLLNYGLDKLANVTAESGRLNEEVAKLLKAYPDYKDIAPNDYAVITELQDEIEAFIKDWSEKIATKLEDNAKDESNPKTFAKDYNKTELFIVDYYNAMTNNNGVNTIKDYDKFNALCEAVWENKFVMLKAQAIVDVADAWGAKVKGITDMTDPVYVMNATVGSAFTKVMKEKLVWGLYAEKGDINEARLKAATDHLKLIKEYVFNKDDQVTIDGGFYAYLNFINGSEKTEAYKNNVVENAEAIAEKIIDELLNLVKKPAEGTGYDGYKPLSVNELAKALNKFLAANVDAEGKSTLTEAQTKAVNDIFLKYVEYVLGMKYDAYDYSDVQSTSDEEVEAHFNAIVSKFASVIEGVKALTEDKAAIAYGNNQSKEATIDGIVKDLLADIQKTTTK